MTKENIIAIDTSIFVRLLVGVPEAQTKLALSFIKQANRKGITIHIHDYVILEAIFVLRTHYTINERKIIPKLVEILNSRLFDAPGSYGTNTFGL